MENTLLCLLQILSMSVSSSWTAHPANLRLPSSPTHGKQISQINFSCDANHFNISLEMKSPFKGLVFAKDFAQECKTFGNMENTVTISLPTTRCGVRLDFVPNKGKTEMIYSVNLIVQQDRHLRQFTDQERTLECKLTERAFLIKSKTLERSLKNEVRRGKNNHRVGRMRDAGWSKELEGTQLEEELSEALAAARAWMEIAPENPEGKPSGTLQVGETALLTIKSTLPAGVGWKVIECFAHDGLGDSSQKLLDEFGCPVDEGLMPLPTYGPIRPIALMQQQEAHTSFPAFKFPDRDRLHFTCGLQICSGSCPKGPCGNVTDIPDSSVTRTAKTIPGDPSNTGAILDRIEVFNSVEVLAPEIDDMNQNNQIDTSDSETYPFTNIPGDKTFCVSPNKMAISFCILGFIFLITVLIAACSLLNSNKQDKHATPYSNRSLFSSSSSGSGFGSKLLPDGTCFVPTTSKGMQYGRIL